MVKSAGTHLHSDCPKSACNLLLSILSFSGSIYIYKLPLPPTPLHPNPPATQPGPHAVNHKEEMQKSDNLLNRRYLKSLKFACRNRNSTKSEIEILINDENTSQYHHQYSSRMLVDDSWMERGIAVPWVYNQQRHDPHFSPNLSPVS